MLAFGGNNGMIVSRKRMVGKEMVREFEFDHPTYD
jgi:hypothetical protein